MKRLLQLITGSALAAVLMTAGLQAAHAADPSAPYRNYPGFTCYKWNQNKECVDFTYYNTNVSSSYYSSSSTYYQPTTTTNNRNSVTVRITANETDVEPGDTVTYSIYLKNNGSSSRDLDVRAELDDDLDFRSASNDGDEDDNEVTWDNIRVSARGSKTLTMKARVNSRADDGDDLTASVEVLGTNAEDDVDVTVDDDNNDDDDCYYYDSRGRRIYDEDECDDDNRDGDFTVRIIGNPSRVEAGGTVTYQIQVHNDSRYDDYVNIDADLDRDTTFLSASDNGDDSRDTVEWNHLLVRGRETKTVQVTVRADRDLDDGDEVTIRAEVSGGDEDEETTKIWLD
jgi:uncharacterized membrane protein